MSAAGHPSADDSPHRLAFGPFVLDPQRAELMRDGAVVPVRPKAFDLLLALAARPGRVLAKDELLAAVWPGVVVGEDSLTQCVRELRTALGTDGAAFVHTVPRRGYRFDAEVRAVPDARPAAVASEAAGVSAATPGTRATSPKWALAAAGVVLALVIALALTVRDRQLPQAAAAPPLSLVLLPLEVQDPAGTPPWFAEALTADLTAELGRLADAFVIARATAAAWRDKTADPREVARALGVRHVVRGSVRRDGDQVRLALELMDGESGAQQWAERFELERVRLGPALDDVVQQIARRLNVEMYRAGGSRAATLTPEQVQADDLAMHGWGVYFRGSYSRETLLTALPLFEQAVARDPRSVLGWGGVAIMNGLGASIRWLPDRDAGLARLAEASARLQELDANHLFTLLAKGHEANLRGDPAAGIVIAQMTIERFPNHAPSYAALAMQLLNTGRFDDCIPPLERALRLSPRDPLAGSWHGLVALCHFMRGDLDGAEARARTAVEISPHLMLTPPVLAAALAQQGRTEAAHAVLAEFRRRQPDITLERYATLLPSRQPAYVAGRERLFATLRELGMPSN
jgi:DNA-binding winged helix-turn-helix (wHTH) protein/TolB-like protein